MTETLRIVVEAIDRLGDWMDFSHNRVIFLGIDSTITGIVYAYLAGDTPVYASEVWT